MFYSLLKIRSYQLRLFVKKQNPPPHQGNRGSAKWSIQGGRRKTKEEKKNKHMKSWEDRGRKCTGRIRVSMKDWVTETKFRGWVTAAERNTQNNYKSYKIQIGYKKRKILQVSHNRSRGQRSLCYCTASQTVSLTRPRFGREFSAITRALDPKRRLTLKRPNRHR